MTDRTSAFLQQSTDHRKTGIWAAIEHGNPSLQLSSIDDVDFNPTHTHGIGTLQKVLQLTIIVRQIDITALRHHQVEVQRR